ALATVRLFRWRCSNKAAPALLVARDRGAVFFLMPALLVFTPKRWRFGVVLAILVLSSALCAYMVTVDQEAAFYLLPTRAWQLALGSIGALILMRRATWHGLSWLRL